MHYDEPLTENPFFQHIHNNFADIIDRVIEEGWIVCVPRLGNIKTSALIAEDIFDHILVPTDSDFCTLSKKPVVIHNKTVSLKDNDDDGNVVKILFSETFYVERGRKYKVVCIERPLNRELSLKPQSYKIENLADCIRLLSDQGIALTQVNEAIAHFSLQDFAALQIIRESVCSLYNKCLDIVSTENQVTEEIKFALEAYVQHSVHHLVFAAICNCTSQIDSHFNKTVRNLANGVGPVVACAKIELNGINRWTTVLGKLDCLRSVFKSSNFVTTDDLLQTFVSFILNTSVGNWIANLSYVSQFRFSSLIRSDESAFLVTTLEAAIEYIKSESGNAGSVFLAREPLFESIASGSIDLVEKCLNTTAVKGALCHPLCACDACKKLASPCTVNSSDDNGYTPLHVACMCGKPHVVEFLLNAGSSVNVVDHAGATPLHHAASRGHQNALLLLLHSDANVYIVDFNGSSALHAAVNNGHENCVKALLYFLEQKGDYLDINGCDNSGNTALHLACKWGYTSVVKTLLQYGGSPGVTNKRNQTPLHVAHSCYVADLLKTTHAEIAQPVCIRCTTTNGDVGVVVRPRSSEQEKRIDLLFKAIENDDLPLTCYYVGIPAPPVPEDSPASTSCHLLCSCDKCVRQVSESKPPLDATETLSVNCCNPDGRTPLHIAAEHNRIEILRLLLDAGAAVNVHLFRTGRTPLHLAGKCGHIAVVRELLKCGGCKADLRDADGNTALHLACYNNDAKLVELLLTHCVDVTVKNGAGATALQYAKDNRLPDILKLFKL